MIRPLWIALCIAVATGSLSAQDGGPTRAIEPEMSPKSGRSHSIFVREKPEPVTVEKNDLILIEVVERTTAKGDSREDTRARASTNFEIESYLKFKDGNLTTGTNPLELDLEADKRRQLQDQQQRSIDIRSRITARVIDVLPNGNVVLEARKERRINEELTAMTLSGEIRQADLRIDDSGSMFASSDFLADLKLVYSAADPNSKKTRKNVVQRVLQFIWPF